MIRDIALNVSQDTKDFNDDFDNIIGLADGVDKFTPNSIDLSKNAQDFDEEVDLTSDAKDLQKDTPQIDLTDDAKIGLGIKRGTGQPSTGVIEEHPTFGTGDHVGSTDQFAAARTLLLAEKNR